MNLLLINQYAGSLRHGMEYRPYYLAREWTRMGHQVLVIAASFSHVRSKPPIITGDITQETIDGVAYHWLRTPGYSGNGIQRGVNILAFILQLFRYAGMWIRNFKPDVVITSSTHPLDNLPGKWIASRVGAKLVYEVHDIFALSLTELGGMSPRHPFVRFVQWADEYAFFKADRVISLLPNAFPYMHTRGLRADKFSHIPNGIDVMDWEGECEPLPGEHESEINKAKKQADLLIGYAGAHGKPNALDSLLDAAGYLLDHPVKIILVGHGSERNRLVKRCTEEGLKNVIFLPPVIKEVIPTFLAAMDVLYIGLKSQPLFQFGVSPNKLIDYMMAGRPVLYAIAAGNDIVAESGCGISIPPEDPQAIVEAVDVLLGMGHAKRREMGKRGQDYVTANHDYRILAEKFIEAIQK